MRLAAFSMTAALLLTACGGDGEAAGDTGETGAAGEAASVEDMAAAALGAGDEAFGFGITAYPGAEVTSNRMMGNSGQAAIHSEDPPEDVFAFYREQAQAEGFSLVEENLNDDGGSLTFERGADAFSVMGGANPAGEGYNYSIGWEVRA